MYQSAIFIALDILVICMTINLIITPLIHLWQEFPGSGACVINDAPAISQTEQILAQQLCVPMENIHEQPWMDVVVLHHYPCQVVSQRLLIRGKHSATPGSRCSFHQRDQWDHYSFFPPTCSCPMCEHATFSAAVPQQLGQSCHARLWELPQLAEDQAWRSWVTSPRLFPVQPGRLLCLDS